jgi:hypothetical protein
MGYDDGRFARRDDCQYLPAGTGTTGLFLSKQRRKVQAAHLRVGVAGTATGYTVTLQNGTTSIGAVALGTNTVGYTTSVDLSDAIIDSMVPLAAVVTGDATGRAALAIEFEALPDSAFSS